MTAPARGNTGRSGSAPTTLVEVASKLGTTDAAGEATLRQLPLLGVTGVREVRVSALYEISGKFGSSQINQIARELLADPITQEYRVEKSTPSPAFLIGPHHRVEVWLKPTVSDPVGESTQTAIAALGLSEPLNVRTGRAYHLIGRLTKAQVEKIVNKLVSNPVIHSTKVTQR
jgi:phosphoribosylformylglycinamidine (FGAM) synthase PurS component